MTEPSYIRNTTREENPMTDGAEGRLFLASALATGSNDEYIRAQEKRGQRQLVNSDRLPKAREGDEPYIALGFTFGEFDRDDPLFRPATLPPGWKREASDHNMWSYIVDQHGRRRVGVFYKAAFYDRKADMHLETPASYLRNALYYGTRPVLDDEWLTLSIARETLEALAATEDKQAADAERYIAEGRGDATFWRESITKNRAEAAKARALAESLADGGQS